MPIIATTSGGKDFEKCPEGNHIARCYRVIQLGTIEKNFKGKIKQVHEVRIDWELPYETTVFDESKGAEPFVIGKTYTLSLAENAHLRSDLESWRGKKFTDEELSGFDLVKLLGAPCSIVVAHNDYNGKVYADVMTVAPLPKGSTCPPAVNTPFILEFDNFNWDAFETLSEYYKKRISNSQEYGAMYAEKVAKDREAASKTHGTPSAPAPQAAEPQDDDLPF